MKKRIIIGSMFIVIGIIVYVLPSNRYGEKEIITNEKIKLPDMSTGISMMVESAAGSGEYVQSEESTWLGDGYVFNSELSSCENGGTLTWDDANKTVKLSTNKSDRCYVYFDVKPTIANMCVGQNMATCMKQYANIEPTLLHHDASLENGANDDSYRYAGASDSVNNYVCFGSDATTCPDENKYRIIGVFGNQVKLIKATEASNSLLGTDGAYKTDIQYYHWDRIANQDYNNTWSHSLLNTVNLNTNYINNIGVIWANMIAKTTWQVGGMSWSQTNTAKQYYDVEVGVSKANTPYSARIGLMYLSDYGYAASQEHWTKALRDYNNATTKANNWMYLGNSEWTISHIADSADNAFYVFSAGYEFYNRVSSAYAVRPVFFLESEVKFASGSGSGTNTDPYRIELYLSLPDPPPDDSPGKLENIGGITEIP